MRSGPAGLGLRWVDLKTSLDDDDDDDQEEEEEAGF